MCLVFRTAAAIQSSASTNNGLTQRRGGYGKGTEELQTTPLSLHFPLCLCVKSLLLNPELV